MKKLALLLSLSLIVICSLQAQKQFVGEIHFKTQIDGTNDPNLISGFENMTSVASILGNKVRVSQVFQDGLYKVDIIFDGDKGTQIMLFEVMGMGKFYKKYDAEQVKDQNKNKEFSYQYEEEYKTICDYKCQKVVVTTTDLEDDTTIESIIYVTKEIGGPKINSAEMPGLEGYPLLTLQPMQQFCDECMMVLEAVKVNPKKKVKPVDFMLPDDAKNIDDDPDLKKMFGFED